jgi:AAA domain/Primase C terminal 1 (PriCT-1)
MTPPFETPLATMPAWLRTLATGSTQNGVGPLFTVPATIVDGTRNDTLFRMVRSMKAKGYSLGAVSSALDAENLARCAPPLPGDEVLAILDHAWQQPDRPGFTSAPATAVVGGIPAVAPAVVPAVGTDWSRFLYDAADVDAWDFPPVEFLVEGLLPLLGVVWWGGLPKRFKSLLLLYLCLAVHTVRARPWPGTSASWPGPACSTSPARTAAAGSRAASPISARRGGGEPRRARSDSSSGPSST